MGTRYSDDSIKLWRAARALDWNVEQLSPWRVPEGFAPDEPVVYGEPLIAEPIAEQLGLVLIRPADDFLVWLPHKWGKTHERRPSAWEKV